MRYFNTWIHSQDLPWHYALGWIHISTPWLFLVFIWIGIVLVVARLVYRLYKSHRLYSTGKQKNKVIFLGLSVLPLAFILIRESVIYDSWRHLFFIYPALVALAVCGFKYTSDYFKKFERPYLKYVLGCALLISLLFNAFYIGSNHPLQHTYINIPSHNLETKFDIDYWGVTYQMALREIAERDKSDTILAAVQNFQGVANIQMLPIEIRNRFVLSGSCGEADYYLTNYRFKQELHRYFYGLVPLKADHELFAICNRNAKVIGVYKIDKQKIKR